MEKYSATYANTMKNFVFQNMPGMVRRSVYDGVICVVTNILQRGIPAFPSEYLSEQLGKLEGCLDEPLRLLSDDTPMWRNTIKGNTSNSADNPAEYFYHTLIPEYFGEYSFVQKLILPEAQIEDIAPTADHEFIDRQVDFYLPQAKLVIEIDGSQHEDTVQAAMDEDRDKHFKKNGIETVRLRTSALRARNQEFDQTMLEVLRIVKASKDVKAYRDALRVDAMNPAEVLRIRYDMVLRFQLLILSLLRKGRIEVKSGRWEFTIINTDDDLQELFRIALNDLFQWLSHICKLCKLPFVKPDIIINPQEPSDVGVIIDIDIFKRWTDEADYDKEVIFIRNDYYDNADYFYVSTSDSIQYELILDGEASDIPDLEFCLRNIFGFDEFRDGQLPIIVNALRRKDTIGILPTGSGKSLCYQLAAILQPCISFVVCPIIALMYDQKDNLDRMGITRTNYISSGMTATVKSTTMKSFGDGRFLILWISPERFQTEDFRSNLQTINKNRNIALAVIDEVHCMSEWGHDFRTSYLNLVRTIKKYCPEARLLGLTATASQFVLNDVRREFELETENIKTVSNIRRIELQFRLLSVQSNTMYSTLVTVLKQYNKKHDNDLFNCRGKETKSGLIFCSYKTGPQGCADLANQLAIDLGVEVDTYHADLHSNLRREVQNRYKNNEFPLLTATKAFGMGIDKPNIRYTIHYGMPGSIESFYQEAGRAGRDKKQAGCTILYYNGPESDEDIRTLFDINTSISDIRNIQASLKSDLSGIFHLWLNNHNEIHDDLNMMQWVMEKIQNPGNHQSAGMSIIKCDVTHKKADVEQAVYKLTQLGLIDDWTIEKWDKTTGIIQAEFRHRSENEVRSRLFNIIRRYDDGFDEANAEYRKYTDVLNDTELNEYTRYMKVLLMWSYDTIVYQRRQAIKTMWDACQNYVDGNTLATFIENYFRFSDSTLALDEVVYKPLDSRLWFGLLFEDQETKIPLSKDAIDKLLPPLLRYLESYRFNPGLNYLSGMIRLLQNKFQDPDGFPRLQESFGRLGNLPEEEVNIIIENTLTLGRGASEEGRELLGELLTDRFPDKASQIHNALSDKASLLYALSEAGNKLHWVKEKLQW